MRQAILWAVSDRSSGVIFHVSQPVDVRWRRAPPSLRLPNWAWCADWGYDTVKGYRIFRESLIYFDQEAASGQTVIPIV